MTKSFQELREASDGYRVKKEGPLHLVYQGGKHIGNIIAPTLGLDKTKASKFTAITKYWGRKSTHDSRHAAMEWLKSKHGSTMSIRMKSTKSEAVEENGMILNEDATHEYVNAQGHKAHITKTEYKNGDVEFMSHLPKEHETAGLRTIRHSSLEKAHKRLKGLGYKHTGEVTRESLEEDDQMVGQTPRTKMEKSVKSRIVKVVKKDGTNILPTKAYDANVTEALKDIVKTVKDKKKASSKSKDEVVFDPVVHDDEQDPDAGYDYERKKPNV